MKKENVVLAHSVIQYIDRLTLLKAHMDSFTSLNISGGIKDIGTVEASLGLKDPEVNEAAKKLIELAINRADKFLKELGVTNEMGS